MSGTNAHAILEEAPPTRAPDHAPEIPVLAFLVSAKNRAALAAQAERLRRHLIANPELAQIDVAATLALHRAHLSERAAILAADREELLAGLAALAQDATAAGLIRGTAAPGGDGTRDAAGKDEPPVPELAAWARLDRSALRGLLSSLAETHVRGAAIVDWRSLFPGESYRYMPLPTYAFQRRRYWLDARLTGASDVGSLVRS
jgi:acyl transferase domain-containing protein